MKNTIITPRSAIRDPRSTIHDLLARRVPTVIQSLRPTLRALTMGAASFRAKRKQRPQTEGSDSACSRFAAAAAALVLAVAGTAQADVVIVSGFPSGPGGNWYGGNEGSFSSADGTTATWSGTFGMAVYKWVGGITPGKSYKIEFTANLDLGGWGPMYFGMGTVRPLYLSWFPNKALLNSDGVYNNDQQWQGLGTFPSGTGLYSYATTGGVPWTLAIDGNGLAVLTNSITTGSYSFNVTQGVDLYVGLGSGYKNQSLYSSASNFSITELPGPPTAPEITGITPGDGTLSVAFTAPSSDGGSAITDYKYSTDNGLNWASAGQTTSPILISGLTNGTTYQVKIRAVNSYGDGLASAAVSGTPVTATAPVVATLSPEDNATGVTTYDNLVVTFDKSVQKGTGNIVIKKTLDNSTITTIDVTSDRVTVAGATVTIDPAVYLPGSTECYVLIDAGSFTMAVDPFTSFAGITDTTAWSFTTAVADETPPTVNSLSPADDATGVVAGANLVMMFDENVQKGTGDIVIKRSGSGSTVQTIAVTSGAVTIAGAVVTINPPGDLDFGTGYYVELAAGVIEDLNGNDFAGISGDSTWNFTTTSGLVGYWSFDGSTLAETSGYVDPAGSHDGTAIGTVTYIAGAFGSGKAIDLTGGNNAVSINNSASSVYNLGHVGENISAAKPISVSLWVNAWPNADRTEGWDGWWGSFVDKANAGNGGWKIGAVNGTNAGWRCFTEGANGNGGVNLADGTWHHLTGTFDNTATSAHGKLYVDGKFVASGDVGAVWDHSLVLRFGLQDVNGLAYTQMKLDDIGIWNVTLSAKRIAATHAMGKFEALGATDPGIASLLAAFDLGAGNSATINGNTWTYTSGLAGSLGTTGGTAGTDAWVILDGSGNGMHSGTAAYTVTYNGNGNDGGSPPVDANSPYLNGVGVTVLDNTGGLTKTGSTFNGWNTAPGGSGTAYAPDDTFPMGTANVTLYAQWIGGGTSYATWAAANGASSDPLEDSNHNGVPNGIEFFMGGTLASPATLPPLVDNAGTWTWTIPYDPAAAATYLLQVSDDLSGWTDIAPPSEFITVLTNPDRIQFTLPAGAGKKFCRLSVTVTP